jgi:uncharacterized membrane protein
MVTGIRHETIEGEPFDANIDTVVRLATESYSKRSLTARVGLAITSGVGTMASIILHVCFIAGWCLYNSGYFKGIKAFDPYPFNLLTLIVSFEGVLIALFVLLTQNRMSRQSELRTHLNLQLEMLVEQELTTVLQLVKKLCEKAGIEEDEPQVSRLTKATDVEKLAEELEQKLPLEG